MYLLRYLLLVSAIIIFGLLMFRFSNLKSILYAKMLSMDISDLHEVSHSSSLFQRCSRLSKEYLEDRGCQNVQMGLGEIAWANIADDLLVIQLPVELENCLIGNRIYRFACKSIPKEAIPMVSMAREDFY